MKKRFLWVEDFNDRGNVGKEDYELLKNRFLANSGLEKSDVEWSESLDDSLRKLQEPNIYDTVILDLDFPVPEETGYPEIFKDYIEEDKFLELTKGDKSSVMKTGYLLFLFLITREKFPIERICFFSANIFKQKTEGWNNKTLFDIANRFLSGEINKVEKDDPLKAGLLNIQKRINDFLDEKEIVEADDEGCVEGDEEYKKIKKEVQNEISELLSKSENASDYSDDFQKYADECKKCGLKLPKLFNKVEGERQIDEFVEFTHQDSDGYYRLKYCLINMCDILKTLKKEDDINQELFKNQKYVLNDFIMMLDSIQSRFSDNAEKLNVYNNIIRDLVEFMEEAKYPSYLSKECYKAAHAVNKFLRNMLSHGKLQKDKLTSSFCAFIFGITMRCYFIILSLSEEQRNEYVELEKILLNCISEVDENKQVLNSKKFNGLAYNTIIEKPKTKYESEGVCLYTNNMYDVISGYGDKDIMNSVDINMYYRLFAFCLYPVVFNKVDNKETGDYSFHIGVNKSFKGKDSNLEILYEYLNRIKELDSKLKECFDSRES